MAFKMKGAPMQRNFGIAGPMKENDELPKGFYESYKNTPQKDEAGRTLNMQQTKAASTKSGKFTAVYSQRS